MEDQVARVGARPTALEDLAHRHASPAADRSPTLNTMVQCGLLLLGQGAEISQRKSQRRLDQAEDLQAVIGKAVREELLVRCFRLPWLADRPRSAGSH